VVYLYGSADADEPAMPREDRTRLARSVKSLQQSVREAGPAAAASYSLVGAILTLGGLGYLIDNWRGGTSHTWVKAIPEIAGTDSGSAARASSKCLRACSRSPRVRTRPSR